MLDDAALPDFKDAIDLNVPDDSVNAVVVGLAPDKFNYETMNKAFKLLLKGSTLIAIHKARYFKRKDGLALGPGPFVEALQYATDAKPIIVGKPEKEFFLNGLKNFNCRPNEVAMIGDVSLVYCN